MEQLQQVINQIASGTITITINLMKDSKKDSYWGTSVRRFVTDGHEHYFEEGSIYINLRDSPNVEKIGSIIKHEMTHLIDNNNLREKIIKKIDEVIESEKK